jgi:hypothetical protein
VLKSGTWMSMKHPTEGEIRLGQGMEKARAFLIDNPEVAVAIDQAVREKTKVVDTGAPPADSDAKGSGGKPEAVTARR